MKILLVITGLGIGGAERQVIDVADRFSMIGHKVTVAYLTGPIILKPIEKSIDLVDLRATKSLLGFFRAVNSLRKLVISIKPDVVHSHMVHANLLTRLSRIFVRMPRLICTAHSVNEGGVIRMLAYRLSDRLASISTNVSREAVDEFERLRAVPKGRMIPVLNGIDTTKFMFSHSNRERIRCELECDDKVVLLAVGRLYPAKDYPNLLRAFAKSWRKNSLLHLVIVGEGPLRVELEELATSEGIFNSVIFLGLRFDIVAVMSAADLFVLSSAWEGFGLVVGEAMSCQRIVVGTDCGGVRELIGDAGFLVEAGDEKALHRGLERALELESAEAAVIGEKARDRIVADFSLNAAVNRWLEIYNGNFHSTSRTV